MMVDVVDLEQPYRNIPFEGKTLRSRPLASSMGGEILDVQLHELSDAQFEELGNALYHHKMIYLRDQRLSLEDQERLTQRFGEFGTDAYTKGMPGHPEIQPVVKEATTRSKMIFGSGWHTDSPFLAEPPSVSILHGVEIPPYGGDTHWYNSVLAYEALSQPMKRMLAPLRVHMSAINVVNTMKKLAAETKNMTAMSDMELEIDIQSMVDGSYHPLVRKHPISGEIALYCDRTYGVGIEGMTDHEAKPLLEWIVSHITQEIFSCRLRWETNTVAIWDNRICLHRAFNDYDGFRREMHRTTVKGEVPIQAFPV